MSHGLNIFIYIKLRAPLNVRDEIGDLLFSPFKKNIHPFRQMGERMSHVILAYTAIHEKNAEDVRLINLGSNDDLMINTVMGRYGP